MSLSARLRRILRPPAPPAVTGILGPPPPPDCPPGWQTGPPDFVGVGVHRGGTTWWFDLLCRHEAVVKVPLRRKELHFFTPFWNRPFSTDDVATYHRHFPRPPGTSVGEWTPRYLPDPWAAPLLARAAPDARLLVMLRDPIERYLSAVAWSLDRGNDDPAVAREAFPVGLYAEQLRRLYGWFPRDQVLVLQYEQCRSDPRRHLARSWEFIGVDPGAQPPDLDVGREVNVSRSAKPTLPAELAEALRRAYQRDAEQLPELAPGIDPGLWRLLAGPAGQQSS